MHINICNIFTQLQILFPSTFGFFFSFFGFLLKIFLPPRFFYILYFYLHQWQWQIYYMLNMCVKIIFYDAFNDPFFWKCNFMRGLLFFVVVDY